MPEDHQTNDEPMHRDVGELLAFVECDDLKQLADYFADGLDSGVSIVQVTFDEGPPEIEIVLTEFGLGIQEPFPISLSEIWQDLYDLEADQQLPGRLDALAYDIEQVEQLEVQVELDEWISNPEVVAAIGRRITPSGTMVQHLHTLYYPYSRRMSGGATVGQWLTARVFKHNPGVRVSLRGDCSMTLEEMRQQDDSNPLADFGMEDPIDDSSTRVPPVPRPG